MMEYSPERGDRADFAVLDLHYAIGLAAEQGHDEIRETIERAAKVFEVEADIIAGRVFERCGHPRTGYNAMKNGTSRHGRPTYVCRECQRERVRKHQKAVDQVAREAARELAA